MLELVSGCSERSSLHKGFAKHLMDGVETDVYNKLRSEQIWKSHHS